MLYFIIYIVFQKLFYNKQLDYIIKLLDRYILMSDKIGGSGPMSLLNAISMRFGTLRKDHISTYLLLKVLIILLRDRYDLICLFSCLLADSNSEEKTIH